MDRLISLLRETDGDEPHDNHHLARMGWVLITMAGLVVTFWVSGQVMPVSESLAGTQEAIGRILAVLAIWFFTASLLWPARKIEAWLDEHYPDHAGDVEIDYSVRDDLLASTWLGGLWGFRFAVGYAVVAIILAMAQVLNAMAAAGYPVEQAEVTRLTVLNSFAIATLTTLLAGLAMFWLINWSMKETVEELNTAENNTFGVFETDDEQLAADGGEAGGA